MSADRVSVCVTLGHDGLTMPVTRARYAVQSCLATHGATILGIFHNGEGIWQEHTETCDAWLATVPSGNVDHVRTCLAHTARMLGQDAIGFLIHGAEHGESYVSAEA